jgi:hypothetical protein
MKPSQHEQIAAAICSALLAQRSQGYGQTAYLNIMEDLADILTADNHTFNRNAFIARCGFPQRQ